MAKRQWYIFEETGERVPQGEFAKRAKERERIRKQHPSSPVRQRAHEAALVAQLHSHEGRQLAREALTEELSKLSPEVRDRVIAKLAKGEQAKRHREDSPERRLEGIASRDLDGGAVAMEMRDRYGNVRKVGLDDSSVDLTKKTERRVSLRSVLDQPTLLPDGTRRLT
jgi:hypothetical protein